MKPDPTPKHKICSQCGEDKPAVAFPRRTEKGKSHLLRSPCKECDKQRKRDNMEKNRKIVSDHIDNNPCVVCGESLVPTLDFHHKDPTTKKFTVSDALAYSEKTLRAEIAKCDVLCSNCHRMHHHLIRQQTGQVSP
jgi:hypothetical protein